MADTAAPRAARAIHPLHGALLAGAVPLFLGAFLSDLTYGGSAEIQWSNFAQWLLVGAMIFTGFGLLWASIALLRRRAWKAWPMLCFLLLLAAFILGLIDCFVHARDAWGIMPAAPILSGIVSAIVVLAAVVGLSSLRAGERT
jgi:uncharacterized membrane protein